MLVINCSFKQHVQGNNPKDILVLDEFLKMRSKVVAKRKPTAPTPVVEGEDEGAPPGEDVPPGIDAPPGEEAAPGIDAPVSDQVGTGLL